ncbi:MAG: hypoxanthine-guanine phosphoribosyltransferase, partial [Pseudomonas sp.]|nr:hypoxanthine-guanine phosphoribosyltransferase [Pseudomonas sp.]
MTSTPRLADALANAEVVFDRAALEQAIARMAVDVARDFAGSVPVYLTVMHGGLPFAAQLAMAVGAHGVDLEFDYLHATRYRGATSGGELVWKHRPATPLRGRRVLLADDILDEGHTLLAVRDWCLAEGASEVRI